MTILSIRFKGKAYGSPATETRRARMTDIEIGSWRVNLVPTPTCDDTRTTPPTVRTMF
jgi:hypothetical protein